MSDSQQERVNERRYGGDRKNVSRVGLNIWKYKSSNRSLKRPRRVNTAIFADEHGNVELTRNSFSSEESRQRSHSSSSSSIDDQGNYNLGSHVHDIDDEKPKRLKGKKFASKHDDSDSELSRKIKERLRSNRTHNREDTSLNIEQDGQRRRKLSNNKKKVTTIITATRHRPPDVSTNIDQAQTERLPTADDINNFESFETAFENQNDTTSETVAMTDDHSRFSLRGSFKHTSASSERTDVSWIESDEFFRNVSKSYADDVSSAAESSSDEQKDTSFPIRYDTTNSLLQSTSEAESNLSPRRIQFQYSGEGSPLLGPELFESQSDESLNPRQDFDYSMEVESEETEPDATDEQRRDSSVMVQACGALSRCVSTLPCCSKNTEWQVDSVPKMPLSSEKPDPPATLSSAQSVRASESPTRNISRDEEDLALFDTEDSLLQKTGSMHAYESDNARSSGFKDIGRSVSPLSLARKDNQSPGRSRLKFTPFSKNKKKVSQSDRKLKEYFQWVLLDLQRASKEISKPKSSTSLRRTYSEPSFEETGNFPTTVRDIRRPSLGNEQSESTLPAFDPKLKSLISGDYTEQVTNVETTIGESKGMAPLSPIFNVTSRSPDTISLVELQRSTREQLPIKDEDASYQEALLKWKQTVIMKQEDMATTIPFELEAAESGVIESLVSKQQFQEQSRKQIQKTPKVLREMAEFEHIPAKTNNTSSLMGLLRLIGIFFVLLVAIRICSYQRIVAENSEIEGCFTPQWIQLETGISCTIGTEAARDSKGAQVSTILVKSDPPLDGINFCYTPQWVQLEAGVQCNRMAEIPTETRFVQLPVSSRTVATQLVKSSDPLATTRNYSSRTTTSKSISADDTESLVEASRLFIKQHWETEKQKIAVLCRRFMQMHVRKEKTPRIEWDQNTPAFLEL